MQNWDLHRAQLFKQFLNRSIFTISGKSRSFEKNYQIHVKNTLTSDVQFKIKFHNANTKSKSFALLRHLIGPIFLSNIWVEAFTWFLDKVDRSKKYQIHVKNRLISYVWFKIKIFVMQLANENLLQYWDLHEPQVFNQYWDKRIFTIFGNSGSFERSYQIHVKNRLISGVEFKIKFSKCN